MKFAKQFELMTVAALLMTACSKNLDLYEGPQPEPTPVVTPEAPRVINSFDFKTTKDVQVSVDYSANAFGAVYFEIYDQNPYAEAEGDAASQIKEGLHPLYAGYTDSKGKFSKTITLPAYLTKLYITTGNMLLGAPMLEADVAGNRAAATLNSKARTRGAVTNYAQADGSNTKNVPENLWKSNGNAITPEWITPLGGFDSHTGRPDYILSGSKLAEAQTKKLVFSDAEMQGMFEAVGNSVSVNKSCPDYLRINYDLELKRESELTITLVGSFTGWNNSLGYYIYEGEAPKSLADVQIIMLFPNTQDGTWYKTNNDGSINTKREDVDYHGAIAMNRGEAVQLKYFPGYKNGDYSNPVDKFPEGVKIGFVLKNNGWGCQGTNYAVRQNGNITHNWWASSTKGLSVTNDGNAADKTKLGDSPRTCKFQYQDFVVLGFEDYGDDQNFSDLAFALRPAEAFQKLPELQSKETRQQMGVYGFEDLWPAKGDYDMNDVLVDYKYAKKMEKFDNQGDDAYKTKSETFSFTTYQNYAALHSGLAVKIKFAGNPESITFSAGKNGNYTQLDVKREKEADGDIFILTEDINVEIGTEYILTANYTTGITRQSEIEPFIFRWNTNGINRWEVHLPFKKPSAFADYEYFKTDDDLSDPDKGIFYVRDGNYPFAFFLAGGDINAFKNTLLNSAYERKPIDTVYPNFIPWSTSNGQQYPDWYK